jgi:hypothetical protein
MLSRKTQQLFQPVGQPPESEGLDHGCISLHPIPLVIKRRIA